MAQTARAPWRSSIKSSGDRPAATDTRAAGDQHIDSARENLVGAIASDDFERSSSIIACGLAADPPMCRQLLRPIRSLDSARASPWEVAANFAKFTRPLCKPALSPFPFVHGKRPRVVEKTIDRLSGHLARLRR
jgi:hypothetical protein